MFEDNKIIRAYLRGEVSKKELIEKGIKIKTPL